MINFIIIIIIIIFIIVKELISYYYFNLLLIIIIIIIHDFIVMILINLQWQSLLLSSLLLLLMSYFYYYYCYYCLYFRFALVKNRFSLCFHLFFIQNKTLYPFPHSREELNLILLFKKRINFLFFLSHNNNFLSKSFLFFSYLNLI